ANMFLVGTYFETLFQKSWGWDLTITTITIPHIGSTNLGIMLIGGGLTLVLYVAALLGIRIAAPVGLAPAGGAGLPPAFLGFAPFLFGFSHVNGANVLPLTVVGASFWKWASISLIFQFFFLTTWNALAMEAAACYVGECGDPAKDAPKAIVGEAVLGL